MVRADAGWSRRAERTVTGYRGPRKKVLVIDDVPENRALIIDYLEPLDFMVSEAADGRAGIEAAQVVRPDLILMDNVMPVMNGLEATRRLRRTPICAACRSSRCRRARRRATATAASPPAWMRSCTSRSISTSC